jgi:nucleotide-binding universal stress UspA family protein
MKSYEKILVPYDFSAPSGKALDHAMNIANLSRKEGSSIKVILLHVLQEIHVPPAFDYGMRIPSSLVEVRTTNEYVKEVYHEMKSKSLEMLREKKKFLETEGISIVPQVLIGEPHRQITDFAQSEKVDLIVIGSTGLKGIHTIRALGSVSRKVAEGAKCPVMLVH